MHKLVSMLIRLPDNYITMATPLNEAKTLIDVVSTSVTSLAVVVGAVWAYFKFLRGRTFRPRLGVNLAGQWREINSKQYLHLRVLVKNVGASVVRIEQKGTGVRLSTVAPNQLTPPTTAKWQNVKVFEIFLEHQWIEPQESVADEVLLDLGTRKPVIVLAEARLVAKWTGRRKNVVIFARKIIPEASVMEAGAAKFE